MLGVILSVLRFCILILSRGKKKPHTSILSALCLSATVKFHGLFQFWRIVDQVCRGNLHGKPVGPEEKAVGNPLILTNLSPLLIKWSKPSVARRLGSALTIYQSIKTVTVIACESIFLSSTNYYQQTIRFRDGRVSLALSPFY